MKTIVITEEPSQWDLLNGHVCIMSAMDYLLNPNFSNGESSLRIINLCQSYQYQCLGYYVSLLAEARGHKILPSVLTIQDSKTKTSQAVINASIGDYIQQVLRPIKSNEFVLSVYFGKNVAERYSALCRKLHGFFPMPLFRVNFKFKKNWYIKKIVPLSIEDIPETHHEFLEQAAKDYLAKKRFDAPRRKNIFYDMAILHNPLEKRAPSNPEAIKKFMAAGCTLGIHVELIEKDDFKTLNEYDALFIRETTAVNHHTYQFARRAMTERLVVIDDPVSILKCTNKVYLAEILNKYQIATPQTTVLSKSNWKEKRNQLTFPCVLKQPDSLFSHGVVKVNNEEEFIAGIKSFFKTSELIIAQAFMPSEFDWRIGIIDHQPLYACRYYMAKNHWQIYNWQSNEEYEGDHETVPLDRVPKPVIQTALKATKLIGDGLYGVDLKQIGQSVYVIEVNDNTSIDHGVEDTVLGDELYNTIMKTFLQRIKKQHGYA